MIRISKITSNKYFLFPKSFFRLLWTIGKLNWSMLCWKRELAAPPLQDKTELRFVLMRSRIWTSELGGKKAKRTTEQHDSIFLCSGTMDIAIDCNVTRIISMWSDSSETFVKWHFSGDLCNTYIAGEMILFLSTVKRVSLFRNICALLLLFLTEMGRTPCCGRLESSCSIFW